jgi:ATP-binding cassette subfamily B multidrug efflux pump
VLFGVMTYINVLARKAYREVRTRQSILNTYLQENITGMLAVQLFNREKQTREKFDECNEKLEQGFRESVRVFSFYVPSLEVMNALAILLVSLVCGWLILNGHEQIGTLFAFLMYIREFFRPLEELSDKSNIFQQAMASAERIFALLDEVETVADPVTPVKIESFKGEVEFDGVSFAYDDKNWILNDVSFHLKPGESLALVGATGAGKTSIISLIARFYDVQKGAVKIDGEDVRNYTQTELRRRVGTVLQDPFIFSGNIADNIGMHNPEIDRDRIIEAAKYVNAHRFIVQLPEGYDTNLSERGSNLSTGQKQLLAMARVLVQNPDFLLILDEATANVDTETEQLIQSALEKVMHGRTTIIIAHRLSTIKDVDRILVMRKGEVIEEGNHRELLEQDGYYRTLYELLAHSVT